MISALLSSTAGAGAALPDSGQIALEPSRVEVAVEPHDDDDPVDVCGDDLLGRPTTGYLARELRASRQHGFDSGVTKGDPVADRGQVFSRSRMVAHAPGNARLVLAVFRDDAMGVATHEHDASRPEVRYVYLLES